MMHINILNLPIALQLNTIRGGIISWHSIKPISVLFLIFISNLAVAASFTVTTDVTTAQTLTMDGDTGSITDSGNVTVILSDAFTVTNIANTGAIEIEEMADNASLTNAGSISASGITNHGVLANSTNVTIINEMGATIQANGFSSHGIFGLDGTHNTAEIINRGTITASDSFGSGILLNDSSLVVDEMSMGSSITNDGTITAGRWGIRATMGTIINNGTITAQDGISARGSARMGTVTNNGMITVSTGVAISASARAANVSMNITNSDTGTIMATGNGARGITIAAALATVTNAGMIMTMGDDSPGISVLPGRVNLVDRSGGMISITDTVATDSTEATITNTGTINTMGDGSSGISVSDTFTTSFGTSMAEVGGSITNDGTISTMGESAHGAAIEGQGPTFTNNSMISTGGDMAAGIRTTGDSAVMNADGATIETTGEGAHGFQAEGDNAMLTNAGMIMVSGDNADGIVLEGNDAMVTNEGTVMASGDNADGIVLEGNDAMVTNEGTVMTMGDGGSGIRVMDGMDATIVNSGMIMVASTTNPDGSVTPGMAISAGDGDVDLTLDSGSMVMGDIDLGGGTDTVRISNNVMSNTFRLVNVDAVEMCSICVMTPGDDSNIQTIAVVEATALTAGIVGLSQFNHNIHRVLQSRRLSSSHQRVASASSHMVADASGMSGYPLFSTEHAPVAWIQAFGGEFERSAAGGAVGYDHDYRGLVFGYEQDYGQHRFGVLGGAGRSDLAGGRSFAYEQDNYYIGGYGYLGLSDSHDAGLTLSVIGGYGRVENERRVIEDSIRIALADYNIWYLSPSLSLSAAYAVGDSVEFRPLASIDYNVSWSDSYREQGTARSSLTVADSTARVLNMRVQLTTAYSWQQDSEVAVRFGFNHRNSDIDENDISIAGGSTRVASVGDDKVQGAFAGVTLGYMLNEQAKISADVEYGKGQDERHVNGSLHLEWRF